MAPDVTEDEEQRLDVSHLARLANLPLSDAEQLELERGCNDVLQAFSLDDVEATDQVEAPVALFEDVARLSDEEAVEAIRAQFPRRDGRYLRP